MHKLYNQRMGYKKAWLVKAHRTLVYVHFSLRRKKHQMISKVQLTKNILNYRKLLQAAYTFQVDFESPVLDDRSISCNNPAHTQDLNYYKKKKKSITKLSVNNLALPNLSPRSLSSYQTIMHTHTHISLHDKQITYDIHHRINIHTSFEQTSFTLINIQLLKKNL